MDLTYREKRIWISLSTQLIVYLVYFVELHRGVINLFLHVLLLMSILQIALQTMLALTAHQEPNDERDLAIERIAYSNAYLVLVSSPPSSPPPPSPSTSAPCSTSAWASSTR